MYQRMFVLGALLVALLWAPCFCLAGWRDSFDAYPSNSPLPAPWEDSQYLLNGTDAAVFQSAGDGGCKGKGTRNVSRNCGDGIVPWSRAWRAVNGVSRLRSSIRVSTNHCSNAAIGFTATKDTQADQPVSAQSILVKLESFKTGAELSFWIGGNCVNSIPASRNQWYDVQLLVEGDSFTAQYRQTGVTNWRRLGSGKHKSEFKIGYAMVASRSDGYLDDISALTTPVIAQNPAN